jgi:hypothetical protein
MFLGVPSTAWINAIAVLFGFWGIWLCTSVCDSKSTIKQIPYTTAIAGCMNILVVALNLSLFTYGMLLKAEVQQERAHDIAEYREELFAPGIVLLVPVKP